MCRRLVPVSLLLRLTMIFSIFGCLEPHPFPMVGENRSLFDIVVKPMPGIALNLGQGRLRLATTWENEGRKVKEVQERDWDSASEQIFQLEKTGCDPTHYEIDLLDVDQFIVATATGDWSMPCSEMQSVMLRSMPLTERVWDQEWRVLVHETIPVTSHTSSDSSLISYKDVRDLFDRQNCNVCHRDEKQLDMRRYPFRMGGIPVARDVSLFDKIWTQITAGHEPDVGLSILAAADRDRLDSWHRQGLREDGPSPLLVDGKIFGGNVTLIYQVKGAKRLTGEIRLVPRFRDRDFAAKLLGLPRGASLTGRILVHHETGNLLKEVKFPDVELGRSAVETIIIDL